MPRTSKLFAGSIGCLIVGLVGCWMIAVAGCGRPDLASTLNRYGFERLVAPRNNLIPGTLIMAQPKGAGQVDVEIVCTKEDAFPGMKKSIEQPTELLRIIEATTFKLDASTTNEIKASADFSWVDGVELNVSGAKVLENALADFPLLGRTAGCANASAGLGSGTSKAINKVLVADVTYHVKTKTRSNLSGEIANKKLEQLAVKLGAHVDRDNEETLRANSLFIGVHYVVDPYEISTWPQSKACNAILSICESLRLPPCNDPPDAGTGARVSSQDMGRFMPGVVESIDYLRCYADRFRGLPTNVSQALSTAARGKPAEDLVYNFNDYQSLVQQNGNDPGKVKKPYNLKPVMENFEPQLKALRSAALNCQTEAAQK